MKTLTVQFRAWVAWEEWKPAAEILDKLALKALNGNDKAHEEFHRLVIGAPVEVLFEFCKMSSHFPYVDYVQGYIESLVTSAEANLGTELT